MVFLFILVAIDLVIHLSSCDIVCGVLFILVALDLVIHLSSCDTLRGVFIHSCYTRLGYSFI